MALAAVVVVWLDRSGVQTATLASVFMLAGVAGGYGWHLLYPRDIAERFMIWAALFTLAAFIGFVPGAELDEGATSALFAWMGVAAGVVLGEAHRRRKATGRA